MEYIITAAVIVAIGIAVFFIVANKKKREEVKGKIEVSVTELKKMTKAKLEEFAKEHKLSVDLKQKKDDIIADIKKQL